MTNSDKEMRELTQGELKTQLYYNPGTGAFKWLITKPKVLIGSKAGNKDNHGYIRIMIDGKFYKAHRLAFLYMRGYFPRGHVDHINMIKDDNRWCNLREATKSQNEFNRGVQKNNKLEVKGVTKHGNKYRARASMNGKQIELGRYYSLNDAKNAYESFCKATRGEFYYQRNNEDLNCES